MGGLPTGFGKAQGSTGLVIEKTDSVRLAIDVMLDANGNYEVAWGSDSGSVTIGGKTIDLVVSNPAAKFTAKGDDVSLKISYEIRRTATSLSIVTPGTDPDGP